jgi:hypothetical protein
MSWKEIAWNGVRFSVPVAWEVTQIGPRYLVFEGQGEPALEIKWSRIKGTFSQQSALRRLCRLHGNTVRESPLPREWARLLGDFTATGFTWKAETMSGRGVILYCPACGNATLIQFFSKRADCNPDNQTCLSVLASFRDHRLDDQVLWSIFDIRAMIPAAFQLVRHRFEAGIFELKFGAQGQQITLHRWGPASVLLGDSSLLQFAVQKAWGNQNDLRPLTWAGHEAVQWEQTTERSFWTRWWNQMTGAPNFQQFRLWHLVDKNRILSVSARGKKSFNDKMLDRICREYESL